MRAKSQVLLESWWRGAFERATYGGRGRGALEAKAPRLPSGEGGAQAYVIYGWLKRLVRGEVTGPWIKRTHSSSLSGDIAGHEEPQVLVVARVLRAAQGGVFGRNESEVGQLEHPGGEPVAHVVAKRGCRYAADQGNITVRHPILPGQGDGGEILELAALEAVAALRH